MTCGAGSGCAPFVIRVRSSPFKVVVNESDPVIVKVGVQGPQGPPGPPGPPGVTGITAETDDTLLAGSPVYAKTNAHWGLAQADAFPQTRFAGMAEAATAATFPATVLTSGPIELTTAEWDALTGQVGGLTPGSVYYLSPSTAGEIQTTPPAVTGQFSVKVGKAVTPTILDIDPRNPIKL